VEAPWSLVRTEHGVSVAGEIDLSTARNFEEQLLAVAMEADIAFVIDLSGVTFMDSAGVQALIDVVDAVPGTDVTMISSRQVFTLLDLVGFTRGAWANVVLVPPPEDGTPAID
jgi:anti-anti-sigma factor